MHNTHTRTTNCQAKTRGDCYLLRALELHPQTLDGLQDAPEGWMRQLQFGACDRLAFFLHTLALINFMMRGGDRRVRAPVILMMVMRPEMRAQGKRQEIL